MLMYPRLNSHEANIGQTVKSNNETKRLSHAYYFKQLHKFFHSEANILENNRITSILNVKRKHK